MEVGAVKQDFNTEVILLKKKLNQAKIQIIHKLTRKAKQLTEKKAPEPLQQKLKRKAESAVKEVLIIKKIKPKDLAKFMVTHKGELNSFLNKPQVDEDKACARLLLHKSLQDKYKIIRGRFSNVPIQDLFMSRLERRKVKKEAKDKQKAKKKAKNDKVVNSEGDWNVEDIAMADDSKLSEDREDDDISEDEGSKQEMSGDENGDNEVSGDDDDQSKGENEPNGDSGPEDVDEQNDSEFEEDESEAAAESSGDEAKEETNIVLKAPLKVKTTVFDAKPKPVKTEVDNVKTKAVKTEIVDAKTKAEKSVVGNAKAKEEIQINNSRKEIIKKNPVKKQKELNKTKHFNEKILQKKLKKDSDAPVVENKIVDSFFMTSTGENYMSVVEPRAQDEVKEEHFRGNRKLRRAVQFGLVPKSKLRQNNYNNNDRFNKYNGNDRGNSFNKGKFNERPQNDRRNFNDKRSFNNDFNDKRGFNNRNDRNTDEKPEKLHPSWEAKKKKSGILPFEGKKIVFDES